MMGPMAWLDDFASLSPAVVVRQHFPTCFRCRRKVDRLHVEELPLSYGVRFTAFCHGEQEETVLGLADLLASTPGQAFRPAATLEQEPTL